MKTLFTRHPASVNENYLQHARIASCVGMQMMFAGLACFVHAIFPFLFQQTASKTLCKLNKDFEERNAKRNKK